MTRPPGTRLRQLVRPWLPATVSADVLDPAIADLQYETERARTKTERRQAILRGYVALVRALVLSVEPVGAIRPAVAMFALCGMGTLLVTTARAAHVEGRLLNSALLAPVMLAPLLLRLLGTMSARRLFAGSLLVAMLTTVLTGGFGVNTDGGLWTYLRHFVVALVLFVPMAAAVAIVAGPHHDGLSKRAVTAVFFGSGVATVAVLLARWPQGEPLSIGLAMTPFFVVLFAILFTLTLLPSLLVARMFVERPGALAIVALACSPVTLIAGAYIDHGTMAACLDALRNTPLSVAAWSVPFVAGAIAVGWRLPPSGAPQNLFYRS
jgi:hypothetical protein